MTPILPPQGPACLILAHGKFPLVDSFSAMLHFTILRLITLIS